MRYKTIALACLPILCVASCSNSPPPTNVAAEWTSGISRYNLVPVYPMQEDVQIGDVFLYVPPSQAEGGTSNVVPSTWLNRIASADKAAILAALGDRSSGYESRITLQPASASGSASSPAAPANKKPPAPPTYDIQTVGSQAPLRLHRVALPDIAVARVAQIDAAATVPVHSITATLGLGASSNASMEINLTDVEEVHLPAYAAWNLFELQKGKFVNKFLPPEMLLFYLNQKDRDLLMSVCKGDLNAVGRSKMRAIIANEVVYAHGVTFSSNASSAVTTQIGAALATSVATAPAKSTATGSSATTTASASDILSSTGQALNSLTQGLSGPGGQLTAGIGVSGNITMKQTFTQPMAVGFGDIIDFPAQDILWLYYQLYTTDATFRASVDQAHASGHLSWYCNDDTNLIAVMNDPALWGKLDLIRAKHFRPSDGLPHP